MENGLVSEVGPMYENWMNRDLNFHFVPIESAEDFMKRTWNIPRVVYINENMEVTHTREFLNVKERATPKVDFCSFERIFEEALEKSKMNNCDMDIKGESSANWIKESLRRLQASSTVDIENTRSYEDKMLMQFLKREKQEEEMFGKDPSTSKELQEVLIESLSQSQEGALSQPHDEGMKKQQITKPPRIKLTPILPMTAH